MHSLFNTFGKELHVLVAYELFAPVTSVLFFVANWNNVLVQGFQITKPLQWKNKAKHANCANNLMLRLKSHVVCMKRDYL